LLLERSEFVHRRLHGKPSGGVDELLVGGDYPRGDLGTEHVQGGVHFHRRVGNHRPGLGVERPGGVGHVKAADHGGKTLLGYGQLVGRWQCVEGCTTRVKDGKAKQGQH
jgi:hypothetical protein